jgi:hypothetical protein
MMVVYKHSKLADRRLAGKKIHAVLTGHKKVHSGSTVTEFLSRSNQRIFIRRSVVRSVLIVMVDPDNSQVVIWDKAVGKDTPIITLTHSRELNDFAVNEGYDNWDDLRKHNKHVQYGQLAFFANKNY